MKIMVSVIVILLIFTTVAVMDLNGITPSNYISEIKETYINIREILPTLFLILEIIFGLGMFIFLAENIKKFLDFSRGKGY